jgi:hypothetical protein
MQVLEIIRPHRLSRLADELVAALPGLRPRPGPTGEPEPPFTLTGRGNLIRLELPDDVDPAAVRAVVLAHDSTPASAPDPAADAAEAIRRAATLGEVKAALQGYFDATRRPTGAGRG